MITRSETSTLPSGASVEVGTVTVAGRDFAALGAIVDVASRVVVGYVSHGKLTTWAGAEIAPLKVVRRWRQWCFGRRVEMTAYECTIEGKRFAGRQGGENGNVITMRGKR